MFKRACLALFFLAVGLNANETLKITTVKDDVHAMCWTGDQITGPIWSHTHAQQVCPSVCSNIGGGWTGHWTTVIPGERSVCRCQIC